MTRRAVRLIVEVVPVQLAKPAGVDHFEARLVQLRGRSAKAARTVLAARVDACPLTALADLCEATPRISSLARFFGGAGRGGRPVMSDASGTEAIS